MPWEALRSAADDHRSGSAVIAAKAAEALADIACKLSREAIEDAARLLVQSQPLMGACLRLADDVLKALDAAGPPGACRAATAFDGVLKRERTNLTQRLRERLPTEGTIVTVSASSSVVEGLAGSTRLRVLCAISEPGGEGELTAKTLRDAGVEADLIPDGAVAQQSARADVVIFGADAVGPARLMNKTGTLAAALGARSAARPVWCVVGSSKLTDEKAWPHLARAAERRVADGIPIFEEVPLTLVRSIVMEDGVRSQRALRRATRTASLHPKIIDWLQTTS